MNIIRKLGRLPARHDPRTLRLCKYLPRNLPTPAPVVDWSQKLTQPLGMLLNDQIGDCTIAGADHLIDIWTANAGHEDLITDAEALTDYSAVSGYNPATGANDNGCVLIDVLNRWRNTGLGKQNHKIYAYVAIDSKNIEHIKFAIDYLEGVYAGFEMPLSVSDDESPVWVTPRKLVGKNMPGSWGGHCMSSVTYDQNTISWMTWAMSQKTEIGWTEDFCDEVYAVISLDMLAGTVNAAGLDMDRLKSDLVAIED